MATDAPKVGWLITDGDRRRDAIHVAVAPVTADEPLSPGNLVGFTRDDTEHVGYVSIDKTIGIVDPFLQPDDGVVQRGQRFWVFMLPNTIESLRHYWQHPAFKAKGPNE